jgi:hypothetical protein
LLFQLPLGPGHLPVLLIAAVGVNATHDPNNDIYQVRQSDRRT